MTWKIRIRTWVVARRHVTLLSAIGISTILSLLLALLALRSKVTVLEGRIVQLEAKGSHGTFDPFAVAIQTSLSNPIHYHIGYGLTLLEEGKFDRATEEFRTAVVLDPRNTIAIKGLREA